MKKIVFLIIFFIAGLIFQARSQTLNQYWQMAAENNPSLRAGFYEYMASMEKVAQVGTLPDPQLTFGYFVKPMPTLMGNQRGELTLMQMFPWFGMLGSKKDEYAAMARMKYEAFNEAKYRLFYDLRTSWYDLYFLEQQINITKQNLKILKTYEQMALVKFKTAAGSSSSSGNMNNQRQRSSSSGQGMSGMQNSNNMAGNPSGNTTSQAIKPASNMNNAGSMNKSNSGMVDVLRVQISIKELENELSHLLVSKKPLITKINQFLFRPDTTAISIIDTLLPADFTPDLQSIKDSINSNNPMLKMLVAENESVLAQQNMARLEGRPMLGAGANYMIFSPREENGMMMGGENMIMPMVSVTLPIYRSRYKALIKESSLRQKAIEQQKLNIQNSLNTELAEALNELEISNHNIKTISNLKEMTNQVLQVLLTSYMANNADFEEVLRTQQQLLDYQIQFIEAITNQHKAIAKLEKLQAKNQK